MLDINISPLRSNYRLKQMEQKMKKILLPIFLLSLAIHSFAQEESVQIDKSVDELKEKSSQENLIRPLSLKLKDIEEEIKLGQAASQTASADRRVVIECQTDHNTVIALQINIYDENSPIGCSSLTQAVQNHICGNGTYGSTVSGGCYNLHSNGTGGWIRD